MKCVVCQAENKEGAKTCRKCGVDLSLEPLWRPNWRWHAKALAVTYVILTVAYFAISAFLKRIPEPYRMRDVPEEVTPWIER